MGKLNFDDMNKVSGGKLSISERNGKFRVYKEYDEEFAPREDAEAWLYEKAEKRLDEEYGAPTCKPCRNEPHGQGGPGIPPPPSLN